MILVRVDPINKQATMMSIPRDLWAPIEGQRYMGKISTAYQTGGVQATIATVEQNFHVRVDDYVWIGLAGLIKVINTSGTQVIDTWAFVLADPREFMSMEHTRVEIERVSPRAGDQLCTNRRRPILTLVQDTSPGVHDTTLAACDVYRYERLGAEGRASTRAGRPNCG